MKNENERTGQIVTYSISQYDVFFTQIKAREYNCYNNCTAFILLNSEKISLTVWREKQKIEFRKCYSNFSL